MSIGVFWSVVFRRPLGGPNGRVPVCGNPFVSQHGVGMRLIERVVSKSLGVVFSRIVNFDARLGCVVKFHGGPFGRHDAIVDQPHRADCRSVLGGVYESRSLCD